MFLSWILLCFCSFFFNVPFFFLSVWFSGSLPNNYHVFTFKLILLFFWFFLLPSKFFVSSFSCWRLVVLVLWWWNLSCVWVDDAGWFWLISLFWGVPSLSTTTPFTWLQPNVWSSFFFHLSEYHLIFETSFGVNWYFKSCLMPFKG